jgi:urea-proton symporter
MLSGNLIAILSSTLIHYVYSKFVDPQNYAFSELQRNIALVEQDQRGLSSSEQDQSLLEQEDTWVKRRAYGLTFILVVVWPIASIPAGVFTKSFFSFWVWVSMTWAAVAAILLVALPLIENRRDMTNIVRSACLWMCGIVVEGQGTRTRKEKALDASLTTVSIDIP